uniref:Uncharacterized protein n=1 Tax=Rhizophora mucronata TaxID=61149 RepID=A0A2P2MD78_RHIMU
MVTIFHSLQKRGHDHKVNSVLFTLWSSHKGQGGKS